MKLSLVATIDIYVLLLTCDKKPLRGILIGTKKSAGEHFFAHASKKVLIRAKKSALKRPLLSNCSRALFSHRQKHNNPALPNLLPPSTAATAAVAPR